jgi:hypothetical protein
MSDRAGVSGRVRTGRLGAPPPDQERTMYIGIGTVIIIVIILLLLL